MSRVPSGIPGFDELIQGGFAENTVNLISGPPGSAKTLFALSFIYYGAKNYNERGLYLTLEEGREKTERAMKSYGMDYESLEIANKFQLFDFSAIRKECSAEEELREGLVSFERLQEFLEKYIQFSKPKRFVLDSLTAVGFYYKDENILRREMFKFGRFLSEKKLTSLLITESPRGTGTTRYGVEEYIADSHIALGYENVQGEFRRTVTIYKMRFTQHDPYKRPFLIMDTGIEVSPDEMLK